jgi:flagellar biosynthesis/type III secretory pathway protein FliH
LRVGQAEYERFFKNGSHWLQDEAGCAPFEVICDMQMGEGGCILESSDKVVNASTQMQLSRIKHMLDEKAEHDVKAL